MISDKDMINRIKAHIRGGGRVFVGNSNYEVKRHSNDYFSIVCNINDHMIGLHGRAGTEYEHTMNAYDDEIIFMPYERDLERVMRDYPDRGKS
tara:strand:- start:518 stop:796 length:279 start_codon:yes stop_codon:yes gene_type:complete